MCLKINFEDIQRLINRNFAISRDDTFKRSLATLREDIIRANVLVREANFFAEEMGRNTKFSVTLQIPPQNLSPNRKVVNYCPLFRFYSVSTWIDL